MNQENASFGEKCAYPCRPTNQHLLDQVLVLLSSENDLPNSGNGSGGVVLGVVEQMMQEPRCLEAWIR